MSVTSRNFTASCCKRHNVSLVKCSFIILYMSKDEHLYVSYRQINITHSIFRASTLNGLHSNETKPSQRSIFSINGFVYSYTVIYIKLSSSLDKSLYVSYRVLFNKVQIKIYPQINLFKWLVVSQDPPVSVLT